MMIGRVGLALVVSLSAMSAGLPVARLQAAETCTDASANDAGSDTAPALFRDAFDEASAYFSAPEHLGHALGVPVRIALCPDNPPESLGTIPFADASGKVTRCVVLVYVRGQLESSDPQVTRANMAHEAFHCAMDAAVGFTISASIDNVPLWLREGAAAWAGEEVVGGSTMSGYWWHTYLAEPNTRIFDRGYSGIGLYAHLAESGVNVWPLLEPAFRAAAGATLIPAGLTADAVAFGLLVNDNARALDTWPAGLARDRGLGAAWDTSGPGITGDGPEINALSVGDTVSVADGANRLVTVQVDGGSPGLRLVVEKPGVRAEGILRSADGTEYPLQNTTWCASDSGCACPGSTPRAASVAALPRFATGPALLAVSGHVPTAAVSVGGSSVRLEPLGLGELCDETSRDNSPPGASAADGSPTVARVDDAVCGPWFSRGWYVGFTIGTPSDSSVWMVQVIVEPNAFHGDGTYDVETDSASYGARVNVTRGDGGGYAPLVSAPAGRGSMGTVTISSNGSTGTALALLDDRKGHQLNTNYVWTCGTIE